METIVELGLIIFLINKHSIWSFYIYVRNKTGWNKVFTRFGGNKSSFLGKQVALGQDFAAATRFNAQTRETAVDIMYRDGTGSWIFQQTLKPEGFEGHIDFGCDMAFDGNTLVVGARKANGHDGAVFVYRWNHSAWEQVKTLCLWSGSRRGFASSVAIKGNKMAVGAPEHANGQGLVYVYELNQGNVTFKTRIYASGSKRAGDRSLIIESQLECSKLFLYKKPLVEVLYGGST